jgi:hypothetical protein
VICVFTSGLFALWEWRKNALSQTVQIEEHDGETLMDMERLPQAHLLDIGSLRTVQISKSAQQSKRLLIFLSAGDCSACLEQLGDWMALARAYPQNRFEVDTLFLYTSPNELDSLRRSYRLPYHAYLDVNGEIPKLINIPHKTPVTIMVDGRLRVLAAQGPEQDEATRHSFVTRVESMIEK